MRAWLERILRCVFRRHKRVTVRVPVEAIIVGVYKSRAGIRKVNAND